jgi:hypothetical protein
MTLKFLIEQLNFYSDTSGLSAFNSDSPMGILWPVIETLLKVVEKCKKKESLRDCAFQLLIVIIKICPNEIFNDKMTKIVKR